MRLRTTLAAAVLGAALATAMAVLPAQAASSQPSGYPIAGVDTAEYQHPNHAAIDWSKLHSEGVQFAIVKATRGLNITDPYLTTDLEAARAAGLAVAPYHFYTGTAANTGAEQADRFIAAVKQTGYTGHNSGDLPPVLDLEKRDEGNHGCPAKVTVPDVKAWLDKVQAAFGRQPIVYTSKSFLGECMGSTTAFASYQLQVADWRDGITQPALPKGSSTWTMWQYTDAAHLDGISAATDADVFNGSQHDLDNLANRG